ncbi:MAG: bifunctional 4-hydroxy-3-methylbut-2-enyl diphosphate reductase/30S ribosomal protein S1 [Clostridia bacterium]|nr:bifunctional 4-hydroxy-3-methylbut-2-enyl diphosphate reductase/30S ribosomal protein S1 [Clostridia bacterium]
MEITVAKSAGFCFGVARALEMVEQCAQDKETTYHTLGPIIHNKHVVDELAGRGIAPIESVSEAKPGDNVIVRTHGVGKAVYEEMKNREIGITDVTCPFVKKIHNIVEKHYKEGYTIVIIGDKNHPEVQGINGWCENKAVILGSEEEAKSAKFDEKPLCVVSQTTFMQKIFKKIVFFLKNTCNDILIFDTICSATEERQNEAHALASVSDMMIVLGGRNSSNTQKLYSICKSVCAETYVLEHIGELDAQLYNNSKKVGITAGASTPAVIIKEAICKMENFESFESLVEESLKTLNTGDVVKGTVIEVRPNEVIVDLGAKQDGFIPAGEISDDPNVTTADIVKPGDEIEVFVVRVNDADGNIILSKRKLDSAKTWEAVKAAAEEGTVLEGKVTETVNKGMIVAYKGYKVFIPESQASERRVSDLSGLVGNVVAFKIIDINERRKRLVGSVRSVLEAQKKELEEKFWADAEVGKIYNGVVKSLTNFGAFVDIGGVDGLVHISELSWKHIKHPSEVVSEGDAIEVYIKDINAETKKISLGFKKAEDNPWEVVKSKIEVGGTTTVKVVRIMPYGAFAEIIPGVDGLIHISQIANRRIEKPQDELELGQEVEVQVTEIDWDAKKIALSIRALLAPEAPAEEAAPEVPAAEEAAPVAEEAPAEETPAEADAE